MSWNSYDRAYDRGPFSFGVKIIMLIAALGVVGGVASRGCSFLGEAGSVAQEQVGPRALLRKYEWFKDASAQLDKKQADIGVYDKRLANLSKEYEGVPRNKWAREDREQWNIWNSEVAGVRASYNQLAAEYNSAMAKINWSFTNAGKLPEGATTPLPREYKPYEEN